ncbi:radical SAM protein [Microbulbifer sp. JMSA004]|uniref:radical SAM protein n=1 Tax=Microbulbifer sp. JMSA004 TaxID=3243370 RepID=UPI004039F007
MKGVYSRPEFSSLGDSGSSDPFVRRFYDIDKDIRHLNYGNFPPLRGNYEDWKNFIEDAVSEDACASAELIEANEMLAAWETSLGIGKVASFPVSVSANITDVCNARCNFCAYLPERVSNQKLSYEQLQRADWLKFCRSFTPNGGGLGEPFAHPKILEILEQLRSTAPYLSLGSVTNGSIMRPEVTDIVAQYFSYLYVSVNAARKETYEWTMTPLKWERFIANMDRLNDSKKRYGRERPWLRAGYVVHSGNLDELPELPSLLHRFGFRDLNVNPMVPPPQYGRNHLLTDKASIFRTPHRANTIFRQLEQECARNNISITKPLPSLEKLLGAAVDKGVPTHDDSVIIVSDKPIYTASGASTELEKPVVPRKLHNSDQNLSDIVAAAKAEFARKESRKKYPPVSLPQATGLNIAKIAASYSDIESTLSSGDDVSLSYEWSIFDRQNLVPVCWAPWRALKINIFSQTQVCCNFFRKLPSFKWTNAKSFHNEENMWNHPYMQHLRATMGTPEEVPYCTLCKATDKRHLKNDDEKRSAMQTSQKTYYEIISGLSGIKPQGRFDEIESPLYRWEISSSLPDKRTVSPYSKELSYYRYAIFQHGFHNVGRVLIFARVPAIWAPFLAEVNEFVHILTPLHGQSLIVQDILQTLDFDNYKLTVFEDQSLEDNSAHPDLYDAIWLDGMIFESYNRDDILFGLRKRLKKGGKLRVIQAPGIGKLADIILSNGKDSQQHLETLRSGVQFSGKGSFFTQSGVLSMLKKYDLSLNKMMPPSGSRMTVSENTEKISETEFIEKLEHFICGSGANPEKYLAGMDRTVSFAALAV